VIRNIKKIIKPSTITGIALLCFTLPCLQAQNPSTSQTFEQYVQGMQSIGWYNFGTGAGCTVCNLQQLAAAFNPYAIGGTIVQHQEWERYQPFNSTNFVFGGNSLNLTATIPKGGGLWAGGINSGQIWTKQTFQPNVTGKSVYAFMVRMKIPNGKGSWPGSWLYTAQPGTADGSEIDNPEFFVMQWQNQYDWTGFNHGPNTGSTIYSILSNPYTWRPGIDFSADYHNYELIWTPDATYKYVDGKLILAQHFKYTAHGAAQFGVNLGVGSSESDLPGLQPNSLSEFPMPLSIQYISMWAK
jgi:hypothetical protein